MRRATPQLSHMSLWSARDSFTFLGGAEILGAL
jgi:hypothetical protein